MRNPFQTPWPGDIFAIFGMEFHIVEVHRDLVLYYCQSGDRRGPVRSQSLAIFTDTMEPVEGMQYPAQVLHAAQ